MAKQKEKIVDYFKDLHKTDQPKAPNLFQDQNNLSELLKDLDSFEDYSNLDLKYQNPTGDRQIIIEHETFPDAKKAKKANLTASPQPYWQPKENRGSRPLEKPQYETTEGHQGVPSPPVTQSPPVDEKPENGMGPFGWIGPKGEWYHVPDFTKHHMAEPEMYKNYNQPVRDGRGADFGVHAKDNFIHVSPNNIRLPKGELTENHVGTLMDYWDAVNEGHLRSHPALGEYSKTHIRRSLEDAMTQLNAKNISASFIQKFLKRANAGEDEYGHYNEFDLAGLGPQAVEHFLNNLSEHYGKVTPTQQPSKYMPKFDKADALVHAPGELAVKTHPHGTSLNLKTPEESKIVQRIAAAPLDKKLKNTLDDPANLEDLLEDSQAFERLLGLGEADEEGQRNFKMETEE